MATGTGWTGSDEGACRIPPRPIVAEGVYSMDGQILDLKRAVETKKRHDLLLMVDEAHSLGIVGKTGRGVCEAAWPAAQRA